MCSETHKTQDGIIIIEKKGYRKVVVTISLINKILDVSHGKLGDPGIHKMLYIIYPNYYWHTIMTQDINLIC